MAASSYAETKRRGVWNNLNITSHSIFYNLLWASLAAGLIWSAIAFTVL